MTRIVVVGAGVGGLRAAEALVTRHGIPALDTTDYSVEEIASRILNITGIERRNRA